MRISTNSIFEAASNRLNDLQTKIDNVSQQVSTGRRILSPSDDPVSAAKVIEMQTSQAINSQLAKNIAHLEANYGVVDAKLTGIIDTLQGVNEHVISAANSTYNDNDRAAIAITLQGYYDQLLSLANSSDGAGHYLFAGKKTDAEPFVVNQDGAVSYVGSSSQSYIQIDNSRVMETSVLGNQLFSDGDIFNKLQTAITALKKPATEQNANELRKTALDALASSFATTFSMVTNAQSYMGIKLKSLDNVKSLNDNIDLQFSQNLSRLQDVDYNKAISDLNKQQLVLQAAQKTFAQTSRLSLFDYINFN